jgi:CDP-diacylglycerol--glycerol-3-phosphate 3-phosphatidyltransferase
MRERLIESRLTPNAISLTGFALNVAAAALVVGRMFFLAGIAFIVGSIMDTLDGRYSRMSGKGTPFGAFLDSTLDRVADAAVFAGLAIYFVRGGNDRVLAAVALFCLVAGALVSYAKARAESLGLNCDVGFAERTERLLIGLVAAGLAGLGVPYVLPIGLWALAAVSAFTFGQRVIAAHRSAADAAAGQAGGRGRARVADVAGDREVPPGG